MVQGALKRAKESQDVFSRSLQAMAAGGDYLSIDGRQYLVDAFDKGEKKAMMEEMVKKWKDSKLIVDAYLKKAEDPTADAALVDAALLSLQNNNARFTEITNFLLADKRAKLEQLSAQLKNVEVFGIVGAVLYLALFLSYFIRKLLTADKLADEAKKETTEIMDTVTTGLFLVDKKPDHRFAILQAARNAYRPERRRRQKLARCAGQLHQYFRLEHRQRLYRPAL